MERSPFFLQLSQSHLQILSTCPRKFQYSFLESLSLPRPDEQSAQQELGTQFHQLMQQRELELDIQPLLQDNPTLEAWVNKFHESPPPMISGLRQSEHQRTVTWLNGDWPNGIALTAIYDLLIQGTDQAQILDWKTYRRPPNAQKLQHHWQTRLYPFILVETSGYLPEQLAMTYWFAEPSATGSHWIRFPYSTQLHEQTRAALESMLSQLQVWLQALEAEQQPLPQVPLTAGHCFSAHRNCAFVTPCDRTAPETADITLAHTLTDIDAIPALSLDEVF
ncbi:MAG: PD-(D/E)XK nuclease family protein [Thermosynechococcaceae cyanobacterium MS004]|nr:PD-(D/E)XK nuclease family protein [Thermosynechococcaceae cyanobacterium MS004]